LCAAFGHVLQKRMLHIFIHANLHASGIPALKFDQ